MGDVTATLPLINSGTVVGAGDTMGIVDVSALADFFDYTKDVATGQYTLNDLWNDLTEGGKTIAKALIGPTGDELPFYYTEEAKQTLRNLEAIDSNGNLQKFTDKLPSGYLDVSSTEPAVPSVPVATVPQVITDIVVTTSGDVKTIRCETGGIQSITCNWNAIQAGLSYSGLSSKFASDTDRTTFLRNIALNLGFNALNWTSEQLNNFAYNISEWGVQCYMFDGTTYVPKDFVERIIRAIYGYDIDGVYHADRDYSILSVPDVDTENLHVVSGSAGEGVEIVGGHSVYPSSTISLKAKFLADTENEYYFLFGPSGSTIRNFVDTGEANDYTCRDTKCAYLIIPDGSNGFQLRFYNYMSSLDYASYDQQTPYYDSRYGTIPIHYGIWTIPSTKLYVYPDSTIPIFGDQASMMSYFRTDSLDGALNTGEYVVEKDGIVGQLGAEVKDLTGTLSRMDTLGKSKSIVDALGLEGVTDLVVDGAISTTWPEALTDVIGISLADALDTTATIDATLDGVTDLDIPDTVLNPWLNPAISTDLDDSLPIENDIADSLPTIKPTDTGTVLPPIPTATADAGMWAVYHPSESDLRAFSNWLWGTSFDLDTFKKLFQDPMEAIIGLHKVYCTPNNAGQSKIRVGYISSGVDSYYITNYIKSVNCGWITISEKYSNYGDYAPYTYARLYLPFVGFVPIDVNEIMNSRIQVVYECNVVTGACVANLYVSRGSMNALLYSFPGQISEPMPITAGTLHQTYAAVAGVVASVAATIATGGAATPIAASTAMSSLANAKPHTQMLGNISGNVGALGPKKPIMILGHTPELRPNSYNLIEGAPTFTKASIASCSGFTKFSSIHVSGTNCTQEENQEIERLLLEGIMI